MHYGHADVIRNKTAIFEKRLQKYKESSMFAKKIVGHSSQEKKRGYKMYRNFTGVWFLGVKYSADVSQNTVKEKIKICHINLTKGIFYQLLLMIFEHIFC